ncbi:MAG: DUF5668 domain-containing protein [Anaerolineae bacterium]|jgi:hypothetical protein
MSEEERNRQYGEKAEKQEKEEEKEEKSWEEKWRRDPLNAAVWAIIIIWAGLVLLASNFGLFEDSMLEAWPIFFLGAGIILLLEIAFRLVVPAYRQPLLGGFILAVVFLSIGLGGLFDTGIIWAVALIAVGGYILLRGLFRQR